MNRFIRQFSLAGMLCLALASCKKESQVEPVVVENQQRPAGLSLAQATAQQILSENFENGTKASYAAASVTLGSGSWTLDDALIGNSAADAKSGSKSVRIRNTGSVSMDFNVNAGSGTTVTLNHAVYGSDGSSTWQLWVSADGGSTYAQVGATVSSSSTSLQQASFQLTQTGNIRIAVRKVSGGSNRINIDDVLISTGDVVTPPGGGGTVPGDDNNLLLGNPSGAVANVTSANNYLMDKPYYAVSYNRDRGTPNWVSWHIQSSDLGTASRSNDFRADTSLPSGWYQVQSSSYSGSGFDRGHNCPSGDRTSTTTANSATFLMTNMIPQAPNNNQQTWANLENYTRSLVTAGNEVYVICGSYGTGGTGSNGGVTTTVDNGNVTVPSNVWKIIVVLPNGNNDLSRISSSTRVITVNTPNTNSINQDWKTYRTSVNAIETATGYNFFANVPASVRTALKQNVDNQ
ncbi:DNA/RNA non-specific endonuclease [Pedobacter nutrimenti]|uniref:Endonuclease G n=1 Tax=Pedobacter nutrimenti TaxID=1241337 RepID=A0A318UKZ3_9SPHI|nr:DNA/RNA non-specific endonuclease [Pedobacter nutrimenti]PYF76047.1 endonuclease G [Pedobacter nutrimenti]